MLNFLTLSGAAGRAPFHQPRGAFSCIVALGLLLEADLLVCVCDGVRLMNATGQAFTEQKEKFPLRKI
jgi:hypothetical protein